MKLKNIWERKMKLKNVKVGDLTLKDILEDIKSRCHYDGNYKQERENMVRRIMYYLKEIEENDR